MYTWYYGFLPCNTRHTEILLQECYGIQRSTLPAQRSMGQVMTHGYSYYEVAQCQTMYRETSSHVNTAMYVFLMHLSDLYVLYCNLSACICLYNLGSNCKREAKVCLYMDKIINLSKPQLLSVGYGYLDFRLIYQLGMYNFILFFN